MNKTLLIVICDFLLLSMLGMISLDDLDTKDEQSSDDLLVSPYADSQLVDLLKMALDKEREDVDSLNSQVDAYTAKTKEVEDISKEQAKELALKEEALAALEREKLSALDAVEQERLLNLALQEDKAKVEAQAREIASQSREIEAQSKVIEAQAKEAEAKLQSETIARQALEVDKAKSLENAKALEERLQSEASRQEALSQKLGEMSENDALLKARLEAMQTELEITKANAENLKLENVQMQKESKVLTSQLEAEKTKVSLYQEDLERTQALVVQEKSEKQVLQEHAQHLANDLVKGVDNLAKQVEESRPLSASEVYEGYKKNILNIDISYKRNTAFGDGETLESLRAVVLNVNGGYLALFSVEGTLFERHLTNKSKFYAPENLQITPWVNDLKFDLPALYYIKGFGRILAFKVPEAFIEQSKIKVYKNAENPFKHSEATIIDTEKLYYGQLKYSVDEKNPALAKVDTGFFSSVFADFSPSAGDLVFDRSGDFLGVMWTSSALALPRNFALSEPLPLSKLYTKEAVNAFLLNMKAGK